MDNDTNLNLNLIAQRSGLFSSQEGSVIISNISELKNKYSDADLIKIYNYMLSNTSDTEVMIYLIKCLDEYRDPSSLEVLVDILLLKAGYMQNSELKEKYINVRVMCTKAIANQKNTQVVSSLLYCLNNKDEHYKIRLACADALGRIGDRFAVTPLIDVAKDENEKSVYLRESAVSALGLLGDIRAIDPIVSIIETKEGLMNKFTFLKERAIEAIIKMGFGNDRERVFKALKSSLSDESPQVRINAIEALMGSEHPLAFEVIKNCMQNDPNEEVKKNALIALYNMTDRKILDEVIETAQYSSALKDEAANLIEEYELGGDDD